jgi:predicted TIM-barrel fold metal-dependent hydrolase
MIIDCHCHIASEKVLPSKFFDGWSETISANLGYTTKSDQEVRVKALLRELNEDPQCTKLLKEMDTAGIDLAVLLVIDFGIAFANLKLTIEELHLEHRKIIESSNRFIAFSSVDPRRGKDGLALFERAVTDWGFKGLKVYSPCGFSPSDKRMFPFYEICSQKGLPVLTHVGPSSSALSFKRSNPMGVDDAALNFPGVNFILGHAGVTLYREAGLLAQYRPNLYLDLSGFQGELNHDEFQKILKWHIARNLGKRLLFGTDWPIHRLWGSQVKWVDEIKSYESKGVISSDQLQDILAGNAKRLLAIDYGD